MPGLRTVLDWAAADESFRTKYARAREAQAEVMDDMIMGAAKEAVSDPQVARVRIDAYKWRAMKLAPKKYGDKTLVGSDPENPLPQGFQINLVRASDEPSAG